MRESITNDRISSPGESTGIREIPASWIRSAISWVIVAALAMGMGWVGLNNPWLKQRLEPTPTFYIRAWLVVIALSILSTRFAEGIWRRYVSLCQRLFVWIVRRPWLTGLTLVFFSAGFFGYFRIQRVDAGDILEWIMAGKQGRAFLVEHAPLETLIRCWISEIHRIWPGADLIVIYKTLICLYGGLFVWTVLWFSARMERPYRFLTPIFFFAASSMSVYFGYLEIYGVTNLAQTVFLLVAFDCLQGKRSISTVSFWYGIAMAMGFWHGILLPAYLYAVWRSRRTMDWLDWPLQGLLVSVPTLLALIGLIPYANPFAGIITRLSEPSVFIPFSPFAQSQGYTLWSKTHLADWATETMLIVFVPMVLMIARLFCDFGAIRNLWKNAVFRFALIACAASYAFGFLYHPVLGFPLDWDLYTFMYPSFGLCGVVLMNDIERSKQWRKRVVVLVLAAAALASCWILQNALFWRYPLLLTKGGPIVSPFIPDFYYKNMQRSFERGNQAALYWLADRALEESPELYREILTFMDDWTVATLSKMPPVAFDYPGWACDLALTPGGVYRALIFDKWGRIFSYDGNTLKWIFAPASALSSPVAAGEVEASGTALLLCEDGRIFRVAKEQIEEGITEGVVWKEPALAYEFLPESPSKRNLPVRMVDLAIRSDGAVCVVDNFNRVWDVANKTLLLQGEPSYNLVQSLHFSYNQQPVTVDVNDRLSYDKEKLQLPFPVAWFHPIVRDFLFTPDERGLMVLDLNGNIHYMGAAPIYKDVVVPGAIIDRYKKMVFLSGRDSLLLLDNRYRLTEANLDTDGTTARNKIGNMIQTGNYATAFNVLSVLWGRSSLFTPVCYEMMDSKAIRNIPGSVMYVPQDAIPMYVDLLPVEEDLAVLIDRWGRLTALNKGVLFLLEGTGLVSWPRAEAIDGAYVDGRVFFLCRDGSVWQYEFKRFWGEQTTAFERTPSLWKNLRDYGEDSQWIGVEPAQNGQELIAFSAQGTVLRLSLSDGTQLEKTQIPLGKPAFKFDYRDVQDGYAVAYTSPEGPLYLYTSRDQQYREAPNSNFGWPIVADIRFSEGENMILLDRYGVIHQYDSIYQFSDKPYSAIMDALALRFTPSGSHALWMRSNGDILTLRVKKE